MSSRSQDVYRSMATKEIARDRRSILKKLTRLKNKSRRKSNDNDDDEEEYSTAYRDQEYASEEYQDPTEGFDSLDQTLRRSFHSHQSDEKNSNDKFILSKDNYDFPKTEPSKKRWISLGYICTTLAIIITFVFFLEATKMAPYATFETIDSKKKKPGSNSNKGILSKAFPSIETDDRALDYSERIKTLRSILGPDISPLDKLLNPGTAQYKALHWLADKDERQLGVPKTGIESQKLIQRYVLAVIFYSNHGKEWSQHLNFLTGKDECDWNDVDEEGFFSGAGACNDNGHVTTLALWNNNLHGTIPNEIGHLMDLKVFSVSNNHLYGELPPAMYSMPRLGEYASHSFTLLCFYKRIKILNQFH